MTTRTLGDEDRRRLASEREQADRLYNDALTALDRSVTSAPPVPALLSPVDEGAVAGVNASWNVVAEPGLPAGWRGRAARFVWRLVAPLFDRQQQFNAAVVDHLNRTVAQDRLAREAQRETSEALHAQAAALAAFETRLIVFLQQITAYVDTKDRELAAAAMAAPHDQARALEQTIALVQQQLAVLKREFEGRPVQVAAGTPSSVSARAEFDGLDAYKYVAFEGEFRGEEADVRRRLETYAGLFAEAQDVLDVGCGRGEFLDVLRQRGIAGRGVETNHEMAERCRERGLDVDVTDANALLEGLSDGSLGGIFAAQVVEHFEPAYLMRFLELAYHRLRPGSRIVLETVNVDCWAAFFGPYLRDITHVKPLPPETLGYLLRAAGFQRVDTRASSPVPESAKLRRVPVMPGAEPSQALIDAVNHNVDVLNAHLFTHMDYAAVAERL